MDGCKIASNNGPFPKAGYLVELVNPTPRDSIAAQSLVNLALFNTLEHRHEFFNYRLRAPFLFLRVVSWAFSAVRPAHSAARFPRASDRGASIETFNLLHNRGSLFRLRVGQCRCSSGCGLRLFVGRLRSR